MIKKLILHHLKKICGFYWSTDPYVVFFAGSSTVGRRSKHILFESRLSRLSNILTDMSSFLLSQNKSV